MWDITKDQWSETALLLLRAYQMYDDSLCKGCGQSSFHAFDVGNTRAFAVDTVTCLGCNVKETYDDNHGSDKGRPKGEKVYVTNQMGSGGDDDD